VVNIGTWYSPEWVIRDAAGATYVPSTPLLLRLRTDGLAVEFTGVILSTSSTSSVLKVTSISAVNNLAPKR
jgi:hypothetical protein